MVSWKIFHNFRELDSWFIQNSLIYATKISWDACYGIFFTQTAVSENCFGIGKCRQLEARRSGYQTLRIKFHRSDTFVKLPRQPTRKSIYFRWSGFWYERWLWILKTPWAGFNNFFQKARLVELNRSQQPSGAYRLFLLHFDLWAWGQK